MAATSKKVEYLRGKVYWAKVLGAPRPNFNGDAREWTFEFEPDEDGLKIIKDHKLTDRLKDKHEGRGKYLVLKRSELTKDGEPNKHIRVYDNDDQPWDSETLIGNGSSAVVKIDIRDYGTGKKKGIYPVAIKIKELVSYKSSEFGGYDDPDKEAQKAAPKRDTFKKDFGLEPDDDLDDPLP
jgi:hypothetical protein